jgi:O-antigen ligase
MQQTNKSKRLGAGTQMPSLFFGLCAFTVICSVVLGGGAQRGHLSDVILQFLTLPLLLVSLWRILDLRSGTVGKNRPLRWELVFCGAIVLVPLLQLVPLPPSIWTALPNRKPEALVFELVGGEMPWMPISVWPEATWLSALSLLTPIAIFLGCVLLSYRERRLMSLVVLSMGLVSVFVGLIQFSQGPSGALRFFVQANGTDPVGFFGDRDHLAALLYASTLLAAAWAIDATFAAQSRGGRFDAATVGALVASFAVLVILVSAQAMTRSRAGLGLAIVALVGAVALSYLDRRAVTGAGRRNRFGVTPAKLFLGATTLAIILTVQFSLYRIMERFADDPLADGRITFARVTTEAAKAYMPFGSGTGSFVPVYAMTEKPQDAFAYTYVNQAHDEYLQVWLETGVVGIVLIGLFVIWLVLRSIKIWRRAPPPGARDIDVSLARAATLIVGLLMAHSVVDYPLRTGAMMAIMAFACGLLVDPVAGAESELRLESQDTRARTRQRGAPPTAPAAAPPTRSRPRPVAAPLPAAAPAGERQAEGIEWPEEWRKPAKKSSTGVNDRLPNPQKSTHD